MTEKKGTNAGNVTKLFLSRQVLAESVDNFLKLGLADAVHHQGQAEGSGDGVS